MYIPIADDYRPMKDRSTFSMRERAFYNMLQASGHTTTPLMHAATEMEYGTSEYMACMRTTESGHQCELGATQREGGR